MYTYRSVCAARTPHVYSQISAPKRCSQKIELPCVYATRKNGKIYAMFVLPTHASSQPITMPALGATTVENDICSSRHRPREIYPEHGVKHPTTPQHITSPWRCTDARSTVNGQLSTVNGQLSTVNCQLSPKNNTHIQPDHEQPDPTKPYRTPPPFPPITKHTLGVV